MSFIAEEPVMSSRSAILSLGLMLALGTRGASAQIPALRAAMREKLANTQGLLEAVVRGDYPTIAKRTEPLSRISETEIASWQTVAQPEYVQQAALFLLSVKGLRDAAASKNIDAVALEDTALISSCIRCHTYVRNSR